MIYMKKDYYHLNHTKITFINLIHLKKIYSLKIRKKKKKEKRLIKKKFKIFQFKK